MQRAGGEQLLSESLSVERAVTEDDIQMTPENKALWLAAIDQVGKEFFPQGQPGLFDEPTPPAGKRRAE